MGIFCTLVQEPGQKPGRRLIKKDVTTPLTFRLSLYSGHVTSCDTLLEECNRHRNLLASGECQRWYMWGGVRRIQLTDGRLKGTFFLPKGKILVEINEIATLIMNANVSSLLVHLLVHSYYVKKGR